MVLDRIPYIIYGSWLVYTFVIYYSQWYAENRFWLDGVDTILYAIVVIHSLYFMKLRKYPYHKIIICITMLLVLALQIQYYALAVSDESYIRVYKYLLISSIVAIVINEILTKKEQ